jgi:TolB protein
MNRDGSGQRKLLGSPAEENSPSFSPAGDRIVFSRTANDTASLLTVKVDGTGVVALTSGAFRDWSPSWGPAGIVFTSNRDGSDSWKLWRVQGDGSGLTKIGDVRGQHPTWARDGSILFTDESMDSKANAAVSALTAATGVKRVVVDVQGYSGIFPKASTSPATHRPN